MEEKQEPTLQEFQIAKQTELRLFVEQNSEALRLDPESLEKGLLALDNDKDYTVSGKFLNELLAYLSRATIMKAEFAKITDLLDINTSTLAITVDSASLETMKAIRKAQTQNLLD